MMGKEFMEICGEALWRGGFVLEERVSPEKSGGGLAVIAKKGDNRYFVKVPISKNLDEETIGDYNKMLQNEARIAQDLNGTGHPNIQRYYESIEYQGLTYVIAAYEKGETLLERIKREQKVHPKSLAVLAMGICDGLTYIHNKSIIHRDIKPNNIFLVEERDGKRVPRLIDFGIALLKGDDEQSEVAMGTPQFMAPEAWHQTYDEQTDIYMVGVVLFCALEGRLPFVPKSDIPQTYQWMHTFCPMPKMNGGTPPQLARIVHKAMAKNPKIRYESAEEMKKDLLRVYEK